MMEKVMAYFAVAILVVICVTGLVGNETPKQETEYEDFCDEPVWTEEAQEAWESLINL